MTDMYHSSFCFCEQGQQMQSALWNCQDYNYLRFLYEFSKHLIDCQTCQAARQAMTIFSEQSNNPDLTIEEIEEIANNGPYNILPPIPRVETTLEEQFRRIEQRVLK